MNFNINAQSRRFHHITSKDGLSQSEVYCFLKDSRGFMWFGTVDGLNRFDGYNIKIFNTDRNNPNALTNNTVRSLVEDKLGRIWIGTDDGLNMYDPNTESIHQIIPVSVSSQKLNISTLLEYENFLFLGTGHGLYRIQLVEDLTKLNQNKLQPISFDFDTEGSYVNIINLKECSLGGIWMQTSGLVRQIIVEPHSDRAITIESPILDFSYNFFDLAEDASNNLWVTSNGNGLIRYNLITKELTTYNSSVSKFGLSSLKCSSITRDAKGNIWVGTLDNGINLIKSDQLNSNQIKFEHIQHNPYRPASLNSNLVRTLYVSRDDILWVGTIGAGVNYFDSEQKVFNHLKINTSTGNGSNFIRAVYLTSPKEIWAGVHSNGLYQINREDHTVIKLGLRNMTVFYIAPYKNNQYFICSDQGLYLVEKHSDKITILSNVKTFATFYIVKGRDNIFWLASFQGLFRFTIVNNEIKVDKSYPLKTSETASPQNCRVLYYNDNTNELLVGTEGGGLHILALNEQQEVVLNKKYKSNLTEGSISNNYVRSIIKDSQGNFWIGTYEGLNKILNYTSTSEDISFKCYAKNDGLPNNMIHSIIEDNEQCLWIGTNNGLSKFIPSRNRFQNYFESDGIQSNEFSEHAVYKTDDGEIIIGGINGITTFYPNEITKSTRRPQTTVTDFYIDDERVKPNQKIGKNTPLKKGIAIADTIFLLPNQNNIGFDFSSMLYPNVDKIKYAFMLEGFDKTWQYTDETTKYANYTNLDHGKYTFKVKSTNGDGMWEENAKALFVHIKTPFKYSWYAIVLYVVVIILILVYFSYFSIIRYTTKNKLLLEQEHNQKVQSLNKLRTQFFINISHDLRTPLTLIRGPLESILKEENLSNDIQDKLLLIKRNVKRLNYLIEQLLDVRRAEKGKLVAQIQEQDIVGFTKKEIAHFTYAIDKKRLKYSIVSPSSKLVIGFDSGMLSKIYFNLISNALKYTESGEIKILIEEVRKDDYKILEESNFMSFVKVEVRDTGKGIPQEKLLKVFNRFYQEDTAYGKGYGIGLSHTLQLVEAHNGYIEAESELNEGTTIRFFIPYANYPVVENTGRVASEDDIYRQDDTEVVHKNPEPIKNGAKTILIVEDNADMRAYIKYELIKEYNVLEAEDGIKGVEIAENYDLDLIVSDVMMPNMDGMTFCHHIKTNLETSHIPIILLTAKTDKQSKYKGIETGADDYIPKPFEMEYLVLRIKNLLQSREQLRKIFQTRGTLLEPSSVTVNSIDEKFLADLMQAIEAGIPDSEFNVSSLESSLGMSHSNFYRKVKSLTGQSGKDILNEMRMSRAKQILMENSEVRIDEVAYTVGFTNPKYFGKSFKEQFGISPTEMKRKKTHHDNS
ncbi:two-component regulator propeller domain-containing protein [Aestuariivivens sediminis]|uniref:hybrid sensor histidine kinase/response regulator transcription factor n=1 Tax=Aestuariivivens sediminis TaxID=2913557 RepID=UPI001F5ADCC9